MAEFRYYNNNPLQERAEDCVTRSITLASGLPYMQIVEMLNDSAEELNCDTLCVCCYRHLLEDFFEYPSVKCDGLFVWQFADLHPVGTFLLRMGGHITCLIDGTIYDTWDCRDEILTDAWFVEL